MKIDFYWEDRNEKQSWDFSKDVVSSIQDLDKVQLTSPLCLRKQDAIVCTRYGFVSRDKIPLSAQSETVSLEAGRNCLHWLGMCLSRQNTLVTRALSALAKAVS